jgi:hypothetical protein
LAPPTISHYVKIIPSPLGRERGGASNRDALTKRYLVRIVTNNNVKMGLVKLVQAILDSNY